MTEKKKKIATIILVVILLLGMLAITWFAGKPIIEFVSNPDAFRAWVNANGFWAYLAYTGMVCLQIVVAFIPGEPLELAAGYAFGGYYGTLICLLASTIGSCMVFLLVRLFGKKLVHVFFSEEKLQEVNFLKTTPARDVLYFVIFLIPGTPKDLLCYFAGLTDMKFYIWLLICSIGRIPSIVTSTIGGSLFGDKQYLPAIIVTGVTLIISIGGLILYRFIAKKKSAKEVPEEAAPEEELTLSPSDADEEENSETQESNDSEVDDDLGDDT